jgi:hypothetical protein
LKNNAQLSTESGMRVKARFILPSFELQLVEWRDQRRLADFDRVFASLDGKSADADGMVTLRVF